MTSNRQRFRAPRSRGWPRLGFTRMEIAPQHQDGEHSDVTKLARYAAANDIGEPAMPVRRHGDEITLLALGASRDFLGWIATGQDRFRLVTILLERVGDRLDVLAVAL